MARLLRCTESNRVDFNHIAYKAKWTSAMYKTLFLGLVVLNIALLTKSFNPLLSDIALCFGGGCILGSLSLILGRLVNKHERARLKKISALCKAMHVGPSNCDDRYGIRTDFWSGDEKSIKQAIEHVLRDICKQKAELDERIRKTDPAAHEEIANMKKTGRILKTFIHDLFDGGHALKLSMHKKLGSYFPKRVLTS